MPPSTATPCSSPPGTYVENIDFRGKSITVEGKRGRDQTTIDGNRSGTVVLIHAKAGETPSLRGFTVTNGSEGGIHLSGGSPLIEHNAIRDNTYCNRGGGGITSESSSPVVRDNVIFLNQHVCDGGRGGGGLLVRGPGSAVIQHNLILSNSNNSVGGAGVSFVGAGTPIVARNVFRNNTAPLGEGGGIRMVGRSDALIVNNMFSDNAARIGAGVYWLVPQGARGPVVVNDTFAFNAGGRGRAIFADGFDASARIANDIMVDGDPAVLQCGGHGDPTPPVIAFNDVLNVSGGPRYGGSCPDRTGMDGNISADPMFVDNADDFHLRPGSPAIDEGTSDGAPRDDIDGDRRPLDGNGDGTRAFDMGADEFKP